MRVLFDVQRLYYLPQYEPVMHALAAHGVECIAVARDEDDPDGALCRASLDERFPVEAANGEAEAVALAKRLVPDWIVVGNDNPYRGRSPGRTALLYHGIGIKRVYYSPHLMNVDLRFVEGPYRVQALAKLYPQARLEAVGFPKLDPLIDGSAPRFDLAAHCLDPRRPTVLYAPTFFPSSIERLPKDLPARLADCNLLVKPHQFSLTNPGYARQRERLATWANHDNVFVADARWPSLVPFMAVSNLLVSEASSALFEFAALDRPVVWCDFVKLRLFYRGPFAYRLRRRMDIEILRYANVGVHAATPLRLVDEIQAELEQPARYASQRQQITAELLGPTDGRSAARAADVLLRG